jgi:hypothetical protein
MATASRTSSWEIRNPKGPTTPNPVGLGSGPHGPANGSSSFGPANRGYQIRRDRRRPWRPRRRLCAGRPRRIHPSRSRLLRSSEPSRARTARSCTRDEFLQLERRDFVGWSCLAGLGDLDSDGCADYAVASMSESQPVHPIARSRSSPGEREQKIVALLRVDLGGSPFRSIASAGDVDHDGFQDLVASREAGETAVEVWSVRKRERLRSPSDSTTGPPLCPSRRPRSRSRTGSRYVVVGVAYPGKTPARVHRLLGQGRFPDPDLARARLLELRRASSTWSTT